MADDQGVTTNTQNRSDGEFSRQVTGRDLKSDVTSIRDLLVNVGPDTRNLPPLSAAPANPEAGDLALQDGTNWDPTANTGNAALIVYDGTGWQLVHSLGVAL